MGSCRNWQTTIARALYNRVAGNFQLSVFMENVKGSYNRNDLDSYSSKLRLQEHFLSKMLDLKEMRINHLGVVEERLNSRKVFIVLDDVDELEQLEALANEPTTWFGAGSRIIVTTEHKDLFKRHCIDRIYQVNFPSRNEALQIFSRSAFKQDSPIEGFMELAVEVTNATYHLPLGLCVLGSSLRGKSKTEWARELPSLKANLHGDIEKILRVGYDSLGNDDKLRMIFLHIACLFDGEEEDRVIQLLEHSIPDIRYGLDVLVERALVYKSDNKVVTMHHSLRKMGREIVRRQSSHEPAKRQFLIDSQETCDVLADETGTGSVLGISFNMSEINELLLGERAFSGMHNLEFLRFYKKMFDKDRLHLHEGLDCLPLPRKLKLLHWEACPMEKMPFQFRPECLVEINMRMSKLKKLWGRVPMLKSLKKMDLSYTNSLEELPDLSEARNLEHLNLHGCRSLLKLPSSIWKLRMLNFLDLQYCINLEPFLIPGDDTLLSLSYLDISSCYKIIDFPEIFSDIEYLDVSSTAISEMPPSIEDWAGLHTLEMSCGYITDFPRVYTVSKLNLSATRIKEVPPWISNLCGLRELSMAFCSELEEISPNICELDVLEELNFYGCINVREFPAEIFQSFCIWHELSLTLINIGKNSLPTYAPEKTYDFPFRLCMSENDFVSIPDSLVQQVQYLYLSYCRELVSMPELPESLLELYADNCVSLERLSQSSRSPHDPKLILYFTNCSKLDQEARELIIQQWACGYAVLPGSEVPYYFTHIAKGSSLTIHLNQENLDRALRFKACVVLPPGDELDDVQISCYVRGIHYTTMYKWPKIDMYGPSQRLQENHLFILNSYYTLEGDNIPEGEMLFDFRCLGTKDYPYKDYRDTISSNILGCGVQLLEPCSCEYDSIAHPELSSIPHETNNNNNNTVDTRGSNKRERSSVAEGLERASKNLRTSK